MSDELKLRTRFDWVIFDEPRQQLQGIIKDRYKRVEIALDALAAGRAKSLALTKLEESFMWVGKALRDEQLYGTEVQNPENGK